jgi:hypothetical protein
VDVYSLCVAQSEANLNGKGYSVADEKRILNALGRGLLKEFPNPNRVGCPGAQVLRKIASREMPLLEAEKWLDHLGSCSPCYGDFLQFQTESRQRRTRLIFAIAASVLIVAGLTTFVLLRQRQQQIARTVLDLRDRSLSRGPELPSTEPPLQIPRNVAHLDIYLPLGSSDGLYEVRVTSVRNEVLFSGGGDAKLNAGVTVLPVDLRMSLAGPSDYFLEIRRPDSQWVSFPLQIR